MNQSSDSRSKLHEAASVDAAAIAKVLTYVPNGYSEAAVKAAKDLVHRFYFEACRMVPRSQNMEIGETSITAATLAVAMVQAFYAKHSD